MLRYYTHLDEYYPEATLIRSLTNKSLFKLRHGDKLAFDEKFTKSLAKRL